LIWREMWLQVSLQFFPCRHSTLCPSHNGTIMIQTAFPEFS
jgi:hypothetical protein